MSPVPDVAMFACTSPTWVQLFQWTQSSGHISGTVTAALLDGNPPDERLSSSTLPMTGAITGARLSMTISGRPQIFGTLDSSHVALQVQQQDGRLAEIRCEATDPTGWNRAVADLQNSADQDNAWAAASSQQVQAESDLAAAQQRLALDVHSLAESARSLDNNTGLADQVSVMQQSLDEVTAGRAKVESYTTCGYGEPTFDADNARYAAENVGSANLDLTTLIGDLSDAATGANGIQGMIDAVNNDLSSLQRLGADPEVDASTAIQTGETTIANTTKAISWARGKARAITDAAKTAASGAEAFANKLCG
jgi:hypothetical protein